MVNAILGLEHALKLKAGDNNHQTASVNRTYDLLAHMKKKGFNVEKILEGIEPVGRDIYNHEMDVGAQEREARGIKVRDAGYTNIGDISCVIKTAFGLGEVYKGTDTPHVVVSSKHTRPVALAVGRTQKEALIKAIAGDLCSPFGGFWGFNTELEDDTIEFLNRAGMFIEGLVAKRIGKDIAKRTPDNYINRFLIETGELSKDEIFALGKTYHPLIFGNMMEQSIEPHFDVRKECVVATGNNGNTDINSLDEETLKDLQFGGNAAIYCASNLVFFVSDGAVIGLGDGHGARVYAADNARRRFEESAYAAISDGTDYIWEATLFDSPYIREDFEGVIKKPKAKVISDAFFPKLDAFVDATGVDRINEEFGQRKVTVRNGTKLFIPKRNNFDSRYDEALIPVAVLQPGGSLGDKETFPLAEQYNIMQVFTMTPETFAKYQEKGPGKGVSGRRFFTHITM